MGNTVEEVFNKLVFTGQLYREGNGKPLQYSCIENPMKSMKMQKDRTLKEDPRSVGTQYATGEKQINISEGMKRLSQRRNNSQLWLCLVVKLKSSAR